MRQCQSCYFPFYICDDEYCTAYRKKNKHHLHLPNSAGAGEPLIDDSYPKFIEVRKSELTEEANFAVKINGESMMPRFRDGDVVLVRSQPYVDLGEIGIFIIDGNGYIKERGDDRLISINPDYDDIYFKEGQEIRCKGLVIGTLEEDDFVQ